LPSIASGVCGYAPYVERASAGLLIESPFRQVVFNALVADALRDDAQRAVWRRNGIAFGRTNDLYSLPECAVRCIVDVATRAMSRSPATRNGR
jgi:UDP-glucose:(heptosyl)LPS alpha-1,3-glucosyltransferase